MALDQSNWVNCKLDCPERKTEAKRNLEMREKLTFA